MAMTGPETSSIAFTAASRGDEPSSMWRSTHSTTTIASSTTSPIARTSPNSERVLTENPKTGKKDEGADQRHRHGEHRDQRRAPALQEEEHDEDDEKQRGDQSVATISLHARGTRGVVSRAYGVIEVGRKTAA